MGHRDEAAVEVVEHVLKPSVVEELRALLDPGRRVAVLMPMYNKEGTGLNRLPLAYADALSGRLDNARVEAGLQKVTLAYNTNASAGVRASRDFAFDTGAIDLSGNPQIVLVDDTWTSGQTLVSALDALLASHPDADVVAVTTLSTGRYGKNVKPTEDQLTSVLKKCNIAGIETLSRTVGFDIRKATGSELQLYRLVGRSGAEGLRDLFVPVDAGAAGGAQAAAGGGGAGAGAYGRDPEGAAESAGLRRRHSLRVVERELDEDAFNALSGRGGSVKEAPRPAVRARTSLHSHEDLAVGLIGQRLLAGRETKPEYVSQLLSSLGVRDVNAADAVAKAEALVEKRRASAQGRINAGDPSLMTDLATEAMKNRVSDRLMSAYATGAADMDPELGRRVQEAIMKRDRMALDSVTGYTAAEIRNELFVDELVRGNRKKGLKGIRQYAETHGRFSSTREDLKRKIDAKTELFCRRLIPYRTMSEEKLSEEITFLK